MEERIPKVSVIIPNYNYGKYIAEAIRSVQMQTLSDIEIIVVDDCSSDKSVEIVKSMQEQDPRIELIRNDKNLGAGETRNKALDRAQGKFIKFLDSDDTMPIDALEKMYKAAIENDVSIVCGRVVLLSDSGTVTKLHKQDVSKIDGMILTPEEADENNASFVYEDVLIADSLYARSLFEGIRFPNLKWEDLPVIPVLKFVRGGKILFLDMPVYNYRQTSISTTAIDETHKTKRIMDIIYGFDILRASMPEEYKARIDFLEYIHVKNKIISILQWKDCTEAHKVDLISILWRCVMCDCDNVYDNPYMERYISYLAFINEVRSQRNSGNSGENEDRSFSDVVLELSKHRDTKLPVLGRKRRSENKNFIDDYIERLKLLQTNEKRVLIDGKSALRYDVEAGVWKDFYYIACKLFDENVLFDEQQKDMLRLMAESMILTIPRVEVVAACQFFYRLARFLDCEILKMTKEDCLTLAEKVTKSKEFNDRSMVEATLCSTRTLSDEMIQEIIYLAKGMEVPEELETR